MRNLLCCLMIVLFPVTTHAVDRTEAQRYYDLGMSYLMSELYEQGLETLNQVAFLYPDSDVADDALYQLALIREDVGDGKVKIAKLQSLELEVELVERASKRTAAVADISAQRGIKAGLMTSLAATFADLMDRAKTDTIEQIITTPTKRQAIAQYTTAIDYLTILIERYPESDRIAEVNNAVERISGKIKALIPKPPPETEKEESDEILIPEQQHEPLFKLTPEQEKIVNEIFIGAAAVFVIFIILKIARK